MFERTSRSLAVSWANSQGTHGTLLELVLAKLDGVIRS